MSKKLLNHVTQMLFPEALEKHLRDVKSRHVANYEAKYENVLRTGRAFATFEYVRDGDVSVERGVEKLGMSIAEFVKSMQDNGFKVPDSVDAKKIYINMSFLKHLANPLGALLFCPKILMLKQWVA